MFEGEERQTLEAGCIVPLAQSIVTGFMFGLTAGLGGALLLALPPGRAWLTGAAIGAMATLVSWLLGLQGWRRAAYPVDVSMDLRGDPGEPQIVRLEVSENAGRTVTFLDLPGGLDRLQTLARGLIAGQSLSEAAWTGSGGLYSRSEFAILRGELIRRGLANWSSPGTPARGVVLTRGGQACIKYLAMVDSPTLARDDAQWLTR